MATLDGWTLEEKRSIVAEYEQTPHGSKQQVLDRHGVSRSRVLRWQASRDAGVLEVGFTVRRPQKTPRVESVEIARLRAENARLIAELERARRDIDDRQRALEALGKATALLQELVSAKSAPGSSPQGPLIS
jgi:transposase-like protein